MAKRRKKATSSRSRARKTTRKTARKTTRRKTARKAQRRSAWPMHLDRLRHVFPGYPWRAL